MKILLDKISCNDLANDIYIAIQYLRNLIDEYEDYELELDYYPEEHQFHIMGIKK